MDLEQTLILTNALSLKCRKKEINDVERVCITGVWLGQSYDQMAEKTGFSRSYLNNVVAPKLWKMYEESLKKRVKKNGFKKFFESQEYLDFINAIDGLDQFIEISKKNEKSKSGKLFVGRKTELFLLRDLVSRSKYLELFGSAGIGKSSLVKRWMDWIQMNSDDHSKWESIIYQGLSFNHNSLESLIIELCEKLEIKISKNTEIHDSVKLLIKNLTESNKVIFLDFNDYKVDHELISQLKEFVRLILDCNHRSSFVLILREPIFSLGLALNRDSQTSSMHLKGIKIEEGKDLLKDYELIGKINWEEFISQYQGNPLALKMTASYIKNYFGGNYDSFVKINTVFISNDLESMLDEQYSRMSINEKTFLVNLSRQYYANPSVSQFTFEQLSESYPEAMDELLKSIRKLESHTLLERVPGKSILWYLPPLVRKYSYSMAQKVDSYT
jgi:GTPase SAR1 family protein